MFQRTLSTDLKFHGESNGAIKNFGYLIFNLHSTGSRTGSHVIGLRNGSFKVLTGYTVSDHLCTNAKFADIEFFGKFKFDKESKSKRNC